MRVAKLDSKHFPRGADAGLEEPDPEDTGLRFTTQRLDQLTEPFIWTTPGSGEINETFHYANEPGIRADKQSSGLTTCRGHVAACLRHSAHQQELGKQ